MSSFSAKSYMAVKFDDLLFLERIMLAFFKAFIDKSKPQ